MVKLFAQDVVNTTTTVGGFEWDVPMIVALLFGFAGAVFVSIYFLRRRKK